MASVKKRLNDLKETTIGDWVSTLEENLKSNEEENTVQLHGIQLQIQKARWHRKQHHIYVTDFRNSAAIINDTIESLIHCLDDRLAVEDSIVTIVSPFVTLEKNAPVAQIHELWVPDLDLQIFWNTKISLPCNVNL